VIVAVVSGKGGVGKSTIALNLGSELEAVVVDADLSMADLPRGRGPDLHEVLAGRADPLEAVQQVGPVEMVPCGRTLAGARAADLTELEAALGALDREFGRVVVDCPAGLAADVATPLALADAAVLVTTDEEAAVLDAGRTRALAREVGTPIGGVVCNRVDGEPGIDLEDALGGPVTVVPEDPVAGRAQAAGRPVASLDPGNVVVERIASLARAIARGGRRLSGDPGGRRQSSEP